jgi:fructose-bisphosphate aldolase, class I
MSNAAPEIMPLTDLDSIVHALLAPGKGILAADESLPTIGKRFVAGGISSDEENRRAYRELLFTTEGLEAFISGVILFEETLGQRTKSGVAMADFLIGRGIVPGIKVDAGTVNLANFPNEKITQGLDGLRERLRDFHGRGARFTKWRAVIAIGAGLPSSGAIAANAHALARFAALSHEAGLVPIVEPEVLMDGGHSIEQAEAATTTTLRAVFAALAEQRVALERVLLKSGMVLPGAESAQEARPADIARATLRSFRRTVPAAVPGIVFLSGGQRPEQASQNLAAVCAARGLPWKLSFSFGRALQDAPLAIWKGDPGNAGDAQAALHEAARRNSEALHDARPPQE